MRNGCWDTDDRRIAVFPGTHFTRLATPRRFGMKKAIVLAIASCLLMCSAAFAFEGKSVDSKKSTHIEQMAKKKHKKTKKSTAPAN